MLRTKYSKLEISLWTHFKVSPEDFNRSAGDLELEWIKLGGLVLKSLEYTWFHSIYILAQ